MEEQISILWRQSRSSHEKKKKIAMNKTGKHSKGLALYVQYFLKAWFLHHIDLI